MATDPEELASTYEALEVPLTGGKQPQPKRWAMVAIATALAGAVVVVCACNRFLVNPDTPLPATGFLVNPDTPLPATGLYGRTPLPATGFYRMQQKSTMKYVDAYESGDFDAVARTFQANPSQHFYLENRGGGYTIQQVETMRFLDAYESSSNDFRVVTRTAQNNLSQRWHFTPAGSFTLAGFNGWFHAFTIQQEGNFRYLDAYEGGHDGQLVTRTEQDNDSQKWVLTPI